MSPGTAKPYPGLLLDPRVTVRLFALTTLPSFLATVFTGDAFDNGVCFSA
jgi:hypothetical protein